jgi:chemotaxis protein histidine kinase CheA
MSEIPSASTVDSATPGQLEMDSILTTLKSLETGDLFKIIKQAIATAEKRSTTDVSRSRTVAVKKSGSMPKGVVPPQLRKPRAWVDFTLKHALENGWESFTVYQSKKDKATGEKMDEEIEMPGSILYEGAHVYEGSVTDKCPTGKQLIHKDAMSLSKQRWAPKEKMGTHPELYEEFEGSYVEEVVEVADDSSETSSTKKTVVRKTAAEKEAEAEAKKVAKEAEKEAKKAEKEAEKEAKKAAKEAEKEAKKAAKEAEKEAKKTGKESAKKPTSKTPVPAAAVKAAPVKVVPVKALPVKAVPVKKEDWSCPADGMVHPWSYKGKSYLRNSDNEVWLRGGDGGCGDWQGIYLPAEDCIDDSASEPVFEDEE